MTRIIFNKEIESVNVEEIRKYLDPFLWLLPGWCAELTVNLYSSDNNAAIRTSISYEYRFATMDFYSVWLICNEYSKGWHVVHDLLHVANSVYVDYAEDTIKRLCPKDDAPKFHDHMLEESRVRCESMTQDLAKAIYDQFRDRNN